jgi:hypothetical protein
MDTMTLTTRDVAEHLTLPGFQVTDTPPITEEGLDLLTADPVLGVTWDRVVAYADLGAGRLLTIVTGGGWWQLEGWVLRHPDDASERSRWAPAGGSSSLPPGTQVGAVAASALRISRRLVGTW